MSVDDHTVVDLWVNPFTEAAISQFANSGVQEAAELFERPDMFTDAIHTPEEFLDLMDRHGVDIVMIPSMKYGNPQHNGLEVDVPVELVHEICQVAPDRLKGLVGINPHDGMDGVRELEKAVTDYGFVGANLDVYGFDVPINHRKLYPFYTKCDELNVPAMMQTGHAAIAAPNRHGKPIHVDDIAIDFPDLDIVAAHTGWPWTAELVAEAWVHRNVYIGTTAYAPRYWDDELITFMQAHGKDKVMWGTDYPVVYFDQSLEQVEELGLSDEVAEKFLGGNAIRVYDL